MKKTVNYYNTFAVAFVNTSAAPLNHRVKVLHCFTPLVTSMQTVPIQQAEIFEKAVQDCFHYGKLSNWHPDLLNSRLFEPADLTHANVFGCEESRRTVLQVLENWISRPVWFHNFVISRCGIVCLVQLLHMHININWNLIRTRDNV